MTETVLKFLDDSGIDYTLIEHAPVFTVAESMEHLPDAYPVKNLLLKEEKGERCVFVIMKGDERLDTKKVASELELKKLQFAKPEILMQRLGILPGSASLFSLLHEGSDGVEIVIDRRLLERSEIGFHPSNNTQTILIKGADTETFLTSLGREFRVLDL